MSSSADLLRQLVQPQSGSLPEAIRAFELPLSNVSPLLYALMSDGKGSLAKACLSIGEAIGAIDRGAYSWAIVKLYYAVFYSGRALLSLNSECHVYIQRTPYYIMAAHRSRLTKGTGTSHEFALKRVAILASSWPVLSQDIEVESPFDWMRRQREAVQYAAPTFGDPECPEVFAMWTSYNQRQLLDTYMYATPTSLDYIKIFDSSEAMIAFPLRFTADVVRAYTATSTFSLQPSQIQHLRQICRINRNPVSAILKLGAGSID